MPNNTHLEHVLPLPEAAQRLGLSSKALKDLVERGTIKAVQFNGEIAVPESEIPEITREQFKHLKGKPITVSEAALPARFDKQGRLLDRYDSKGQPIEGLGYGIYDDTIRLWVKKYQYVKVLSPGYGMTLDEADVAFCAAVYHERKKAGTLKKVPLLDDAGRPYQLKHPSLSEYRRKKKQASPLHEASAGYGRASARVAKGKACKTRKRKQYDL